MVEPRLTARGPSSFPDLIERALAGESLSAREAESAFEDIMSGEVSVAAIAGWLTALRAKGAAPTEVAGGVRALRRAMVRVPIPDPDSLVDTAGTGGGSVTTFNVSTTAAIVAAGAGVRVAKHGNRSFTSRCGSADVLEELGVAIDLPAERMPGVLQASGMVFMFAPNLHPAMGRVAPARRGLGISTVMNLLGPLANPAGVRRQVVGVSDAKLVPLVAGALAELGDERAMVVYGEPGMDELSPCGTTYVAEVRRRTVRSYQVTPGELGIEAGPPEALAGGSPEENAAAIRAVLEGERGVRRAAVVMNAGAAIWVAGLVDTLAEGVRAAALAIDDGQARLRLDLLVVASSARARQ